MKRGGVEFYAVKGDVEIDFHVRAVDPDPNDPVTTRQVTQILEEGTLVIGATKIRNVTPPHEGYEEFGAAVNRYRIGLIFGAFSIDGGDLLADLEDAFSGAALIHGCHDFDSPGLCRACSLLHRVKKMRQQMVFPEAT